MGRGEPLAWNLFARGVFAFGKEGILKGIVGVNVWINVGEEAQLCFSLVAFFFFLTKAKKKKRYSHW